MMKMSQTRSVDDLLVRVQNEQTGVDNGQLGVTVTPEPESSPPEVNNEVVQQENESIPEVYDSEVPEVPKEEIKEVKEVKPDSPIDEYGNPLEKPKTYTEEEVQRMIRDRLSRGRQVDQTQQNAREINQKSEDFKSDPNSDDSWEVQLEQFIDKTIEKRQTRHSEEQWRAQEAQKQAEFESKFNVGMNKYQDFQQVVAGKPITDSMMMATRNLENPAAFVYAASKMHAQELQRIASIPDPSSQIMEIGRLHERMVKENRSVSSAPKPVAAVKGDMPIKQQEYPSIDQRIHIHAKQKFARK